MSTDSDLKDRENIARVVANHGTELTLATQSGERISATPKKKLGLIVTGDLVHWNPEEHGNARVTKVVERHGTLARADRLGAAKPIATNVSLLLVVTAPKPPFDTLLIDRYCIAAHNIGAEIAVVINKQDLLDTESAPVADEIESTYKSIGYPVVRCSVKQEQGLDSIQSILVNEVSILVGQSGVGKSSLLNALLPEQGIKTGPLSVASGLGRHTTTVTNWYDLPTGGAIIDSPGVRQFSLEHLGNVDIQAGFREISELSAGCKFNDCTHHHEPSCAVLDAVNEGDISKRRYDHFQQLIRGDESTNA